MDTVIAIFISLLVYYLLTKVYAVCNIKLKGRGTHPLALFIVIQICIFSFPGVILISFLGFDSFRYETINEGTRFEIGLWYLYSIVVFALVNLFFLTIFHIKSYNKYVSQTIPYNPVIYKATTLVLFALFSLLIKLLLSKTPPLFYLIEGDFEKAYQSRIDIQINQQDYYIPYISNLTSLLSIYQFYFLYYFYSFADRKTLYLKCLVLVSFLLASIECLYETQKAPLIFMLLGVVFIFYLKTHKIKKLIISLGLIFSFAVVLQSIIIGSNLSDALSSAADRFLLGQNQGFYHIINSIKPDAKYWFSSFYFIERLGVVTSRADVDVIPYMTYYKGADIVNVNSYYLGEAWSMFGYYGLILSPFIVAFSVALFIKILDLFIGFKPLYYIPFAIYAIPEFRLNQAFNYFLFGKEFIFKLIMIFIIITLIDTFSSLFKRKTCHTIKM